MRREPYILLYWEVVIFPCLKNRCHLPYMSTQFLDVVDTFLSGCGLSIPGALLFLFRVCICFIQLEDDLNLRLSADELQLFSSAWCLSKCQYQIYMYMYIIFLWHSRPQHINQNIKLLWILKTSLSLLIRFWEIYCNMWHSIKPYHTCCK